jgi:GTP cyclohydrolase I
MKDEEAQKYRQDPIAVATYTVMEEIGISGRSGVAETPARVAKMWREELSIGVAYDPAEDLSVTFQEPGADQIVLEADIPFYSMCEHHMLPFFGVAHVAYIPQGGSVVGLSKLARVLQGYARQPGVQERLGQQVVNAIMTHLNALGAACVIQGRHMCMEMRGVAASGVETRTSCMAGVFLNRPQARNELMNLIAFRRRT